MRWWCADPAYLKRERASGRVAAGSLVAPGLELFLSVDEGGELVGCGGGEEGQASGCEGHGSQGVFPGGPPAPGVADPDVPYAIEGRLDF
jgi:hypothetical protein